MQLPGNVSGLWAAYQAPILASAVALAALGLSRAPAAPAGALGVLVGWAALTPIGALLRATPIPRTPSDFLLLPALATVVVGLAGSHLRGRVGRWAPALLAVGIGWWLAGMPAGHREFWRVWLAIGLATWLLHRAVAGQAGRAFAAALALWGGLVVTGAPAVWSLSALVLVAAAPGGVPPALIAAAAAAAAIGAGRLVRGGLDPLDVACAGTLAAPWATGQIAGRLRRLGRAGAVLAVLGGAGLAVGAAWCAVRIARA